MQKNFTFFQLPGPGNFQDRVTDLGSDGERYWYGRSGSDQIGHLNPRNGKFQEFRFAAASGSDIGPGKLLLHRVPGGSRRARLMGGAEKNNALLVWTEGNRRAELLHLGPYENHQIEFKPEALGRNRLGHIWTGMWIRNANDPLSVGWEPGFCRLTPVIGGGYVTECWLLPPWAKGVVRSIWFDDKDRAWMAIGQTNSFVTGGYSILVADPAANEFTFWDVPLPGTRDHLDVTGTAGTDDLWFNWGQRGSVLKTRDIYTPLSGPGTPSRVEVFEGIGDVRAMASDSHFNAWFSNPSKEELGGLKRNAAPDSVLLATAIDETLQYFQPPVSVEEVKVDRVGDGESKVHKKRIEGVWDPTNRWMTWPLEKAPAVVIPTNKAIWFNIPQLAQIGAMQH